MKEASGELNMTVVTIVAIAGIAAFFAMVLWPNIKKSINNNWGNAESNAVFNKDI